MSIFAELNNFIKNIRLRMRFDPTCTPQKTSWQSRHFANHFQVLDLSRSYWFLILVYYHTRSGVVIVSLASVCLYVCSSVFVYVCNTITFEGLDVETSFSVCEQMLKGYGSSSYYEGHRIKVKVTGAKNAKFHIPAM